MMSERIGGQARRVLQKGRVRKDGWTITRRRRFLNMLAETCNVRHSCEVAGMSPYSAYDLRRRDPAFAALWEEALARGYEVLEQALLSHALAGVNAIAIGEPIDGDEAIDPKKMRPGTGFDRQSFNPASVQLALALLNRHRQSIDRKPHRGKRATPEETNAALKKQLDTLAKKLNGGKAEDAA